MNFNEYIRQIEQCLDKASPAQLRQVIRQMAEDVPTDLRDGFLHRVMQLADDAETIKKVNPDQIGRLEKKVSKLLSRMDAEFSGDSSEPYGNGYGSYDWDGDWAGEMEQYLKACRKLALSGNYQTAEELYGKLLAALDDVQGSDLAQTFGEYSEDLMPVFDDPIDEHLAVYLAAVYQMTPPPKRPDVIYRRLDAFEYLGYGFEIGDIAGALAEPLPDFDVFIDGWIKLLLAKKPSDLKEQLRFALALQSVEKLAEFAGKHYLVYPEACLDWVDRLIETGESHNAIAAAQHCMTQPDLKPYVRARLADRLATLGHTLGDAALQLDASRQAFEIDANLERLVQYLAVLHFDHATQAIDAGIAFIREHIKRLKPYDTELKLHALFLIGEYNAARNVIQDQKPTDTDSWQYDDRSLYVSFQLHALLYQAGVKVTIDQIWRLLAIRESADFNYTAFAARLSGEPEPLPLMTRYLALLNQTLAAHPLTEGQIQHALDWSQHEVERRLAKILENKNRYRYTEAAMLLVALAEAVGFFRGQDTAKALLESNRQRYKRFSAFRNELLKAQDTMIAK